MREHRYAARLAYERDAFLRLYPLARNVGPGPSVEILYESVAYREGVALIDQKLRDVRTREHLAVRQRLRLLDAHWDAEFVQLFENPRVSLAALPPYILEPFFKISRAGRDAVAEYVQRVRRGGGELYAAEAADALALAGLHKDRQPRRSVVVRKREQR